MLLRSPSLKFRYNVKRPHVDFAILNVLHGVLDELREVLGILLQELDERFFVCRDGVPIGLVVVLCNSLLLSDQDFRAIDFLWCND